jgi:magnesium-protoporphyrin O-methyltransferase
MMSSCCTPGGEAAARHFGPDAAEADRARYVRDGPDRRTRLLLDGLTRLGIDGCSVLDIGSGIGVVSFELLKRGAKSAILSDASPSYLDAAGVEAGRCRVTDRVRLVQGDFVETAREMEPADVVVLDRAVCCYPAWRPLLHEAAARCRRLLGLTYPWSRPDIRVLLAVENLRRRLARDPFRAFVHSPAGMDASLRQHGLHRIHRAATFFWRIDIYTRDGV